MKLNKIDLINAIETSKKNLNWKNMLLDYIRIFCFSMALGIVLKMNLIWYALGSSATIGVMGFYKVHKYNRAKNEAKKQLDYLVNYLNQNGIDVNKISLQKAKIGETKKYNYSDKQLAIDCETEKIAVFEDNQQKLKALRQVRHDILFVRGASEKDTTLDADIEIIEREEAAKELLLKINKGA